ncbi:hypothetical protein [Nostoc sp.]|uniref:hypothetical protein n=1 Tax=Nostoc sp. TaxID=1180 RepID=UPI002FF47983
MAENCTFEERSLLKCATFPLRIMRAITWAWSVTPSLGLKTAHQVKARNFRYHSSFHPFAAYAYRANPVL